MSVRLLLLPVVLALAGCASVGLDYAPPRLDMPVGWSQAEDTDTITTASPDDIGRWWKRLGDPLLARLVEEALEASPGMRLAVTRLREARARRAVESVEVRPLARLGDAKEAIRNLNKIKSIWRI